MSRDDLNLVIAIATLLFAVVAAVASVQTIRRDRAALRVRWGSGAAGTLYMNVSNVGLRPVRITGAIARPHRWAPLARPVALPSPHVLYVPDDPGLQETGIGGEGRLPFVLQAAGEFIIGIPTPVVGAYPRVGVEDAAGRRYWLDTRDAHPDERYKLVDIGAVMSDGKQHSVEDPVAPSADVHHPRRQQLPHPDVAVDAGRGQAGLLHGVRAATHGRCDAPESAAGPRRDPRHLQ